MTERTAGAGRQGTRLSLGAGRSHGLPHTAGRLAVRDVLVMAKDETIGRARQMLSERKHASDELVLCVDQDGRFAGAVSLRSIVENAEERQLSAIMHPLWPSVTTRTDQEHAVEHAMRERVTALAVVDADHRPIGVLPALLLMDVLGQEHREDLDRLVGVMRERQGARHALEDMPLRRAMRRLPWLFAGLVLSTGATLAMASFEEAMKAKVTIAFFIPALVYIADAIGTQTEAIAVRGLSLSHRPFKAVLLAEIVTGLIIGIVLGTLAYVGILYVYGDRGIATGVGLSIVAAGTMASGIGLALPWTLAKLGIDPAFGSGPVATILQDMITIVIYFLIMARLIGV